MTRLESLQRLNEVIEPFDPAYISDKPYEIPDLSNREKRFLHKVSILEHKLRRNGISYEWIPETECFRIKRYNIGSDYPTYRYVGVNVDENDYWFGTETEDLVFDGRSSVVVEAASKWVNRKLINKNDYEKKFAR